MAEPVQAFREYLSNYTKITDLCFNDCVNDFTSREVGIINMITNRTAHMCKYDN